MVPPKLKLVKTDDRDVSEADDDASAEAIELAAALADVQTGLPGGFGELSRSERSEQLRIIEAVIFASPEPVDEAMLKTHIADDDGVPELLEELQALYANRGVHLVRVAGKWSFRTADDLAFVLQKYAKEKRRLSKAALETLAIIAYHQPVTRAEIEEVRGVSISTGTLDILMETGWVRPRGRRRAPGKPITYGTTETFLSYFSLPSVQDLPGLRELKAAGLLDSTLPPGFDVPTPSDVAALMPDELPLDSLSDDDDDSDEDPEDDAGHEFDDESDALHDGDDSPVRDETAGSDER